MRDRVIMALGVVAAGSPGVPPVGSGDIGPPAARIVERNRPVRGVKHGRAFDQECGIGLGVVSRIERALGDGEVPGLFGKARELLDCDRSPVDRKAADLYLAHGSLLGVEAGRSHPEATRGYVDHAVASRADRGAVGSDVLARQRNGRRSWRSSRRSSRRSPRRRTPRVATAAVPATAAVRATGRPPSTPGLPTRPLPSISDSFLRGCLICFERAHKRLDGDPATGHQLTP